MANNNTFIKQLDLFIMEQWNSRKINEIKFKEIYKKITY